MLVPALAGPLGSAGVWRWVPAPWWALESASVLALVCGLPLVSAWVSA